VALVDARRSSRPQRRSSRCASRSRRWRSRSSASCAKSRWASRTSRAAPLLRQLTTGVAAALLFAGFAETLLFAMATALGRGPSFIAVMGTLPGRRGHRRRHRLGEVDAQGRRAAPRGHRAVSVRPRRRTSGSCPRLSVVLPAMAIAGNGDRLGDRRPRTAYQRYSPRDLQRKGVRAANMLFSVPQTISIAAGAALITTRRPTAVEIVAIGRRCSCSRPDTC